MNSLKPAKNLPVSDIFAFIMKILGPERDFYTLAIIYGVGISLLSLALPISVQMLINTVANTALVTPLAVLALTLFVLLLISGLLNALRIHLMELFGRRFYARMISEIALRTVYSINPFFHDFSRGPLFNRYFDIVIVQKAVPPLMIGGFTLVLQAIVGFVLVSLYHPLFLVFNIVFLALIWCVLAAQGPSAIRSAVDLSHAKHAAAAWLEDAAASNGFFRSERHIAFALSKTDAVTKDYVEHHQRHFRVHFTQTIFLLIIYAAASAMLLGLGGWLVIQGQLTLGQLVAAELVLSAVFAGVAQFSTYLTSFYDLCAAIEELSHFYEVAQEPLQNTNSRCFPSSALTFTNVRAQARSGNVEINLSIKNGAKLLATTDDHGSQRLFSHLLRRFAEPDAGMICVGGVDLKGTNIHALRRSVIVLDRPSIMEITIREYLRLACENAQPEQILDFIKIVGLKEIIAALPEGIDTKLASTGWPLSVTEVMQLKLAGALLANPQVLVVNQLIDMLPTKHFSNIMRTIKANANMTFIYFSNHTNFDGFEGILHLGSHKQKVFPLEKNRLEANPTPTSAITDSS